MSKCVALFVTFSSVNVSCEKRHLFHLNDVNVKLLPLIDYLEIWTPFEAKVIETFVEKTNERRI